MIGTAGAIDGSRGACWPVGFPASDPPFLPASCQGRDDLSPRRFCLLPAAPGCPLRGCRRLLFLLLFLDAATLPLLISFDRQRPRHPAPLPFSTTAPPPLHTISLQMPSTYDSLERLSQPSTQNCLHKSIRHVCHTPAGYLPPNNYWRAAHS